MMTTRPPYSSAAASSGAPAGSPVRGARSARRSRYPVTTAIPPSPSASSRAATACSAAMDASTNDARSARSSTGYPVSIISGNTTTLAPARGGPPRPLHDQLGVSVQVPDRRIDLGHRDPQLCHASSLGRSSLTPPSPVL